MTIENSFVQPVIPRFDGHYDHWSMLMENFLRSKEYWSLVETGISAIDQAILETILKKDTAKDIWDSLKQKYQGTTRVKRAQLQALRKEFEILHMKEGESVNEYFARTLTIANKMWIHGEKMEDVVCFIEESNDLDILSIDELQSSLLVHEQRMGRHTVDKQALKVTHEECPKKEKDSKGFYSETSEEMLLMAYVDIKEDDREELWFLDSGCINHMCGKKEMFMDFDDTFRKSIKLGNSSSLAVLGKGNVRMEVNGIMQVITGVFYVPDLRNNLLSIGQLQEKDLVFLIKHGKCKIYHPER
ncbi:PREDICTED: uncharacterized protein LOC103328157 [Prunus mume]|uniref:Uncharacterized protein LOC103328157 n=1 Tax=Prunus mume TaxID=102107 RepID=A0ABM1LHP2_PRUMU|nr:PREDICTED: uncharacterized protein LOC103328157 [Prunus mume]